MSPTHGRCEFAMHVRGQTWAVDILNSFAVSVLPNRPIVLLVEDDRDGRQMYAEWLQQAGFRVEQAHNGLQALERAFDLRPDVVVTDLNIPGIDGYELTRRLKADVRTSATPIVAVTGYGPFTQDPSRADRAGCDTVLSKPCSPEDLEAAIRGLIDKHASESSF
jgi:two-component system, cell cycle response regulator DivK